MNQRREKGTCEKADPKVVALYSQYFENERHPSSDETLLQATKDAEIPEAKRRNLSRTRARE